MVLLRPVQKSPDQKSPLYKCGYFEVSCFNRETAPARVSECSAGSAGGWELVSIFQREKRKPFSDLGWACSNMGGYTVAIYTDQKPG